MRERTPVHAGAELARAYRVCESITRERAGNFYYGIRLLPAERRRAMCAVYAFARRIDDIGDGARPASEKLELLEQAELSLASLLPGGAEPLADTKPLADAEPLAGPEPLADAEPPAGADPVLLALLDARERFAIDPRALAELIAGVRMDVRGTRYEHVEELVGYCRLVAGTIGRLCLAIFTGGAATDQETVSLADDLGVALQLTNILRDVREDADSGRVYLPAEDLRRFELDDLAAALQCAASNTDVLRRLSALVRFEADRAQDWFERGMRLVPLLDRRSAACVLAMAGIYRRLLRRIAAEPQRVLRERVSVPGPEKAWVAARALAAAAR